MHSIEPLWAKCEELDRGENMIRGHEMFLAALKGDCNFVGSLSSMAAVAINF